MGFLYSFARRLGRPIKRWLFPPFVPGPETIIFLHIPKAAGTTLKVITQQLYVPRVTYEIVDGLTKDSQLAAFRALSEAERRRIKFLQGHFPFGLHEHLPQPAAYITLLRDPVERILSSYYYILREPKHFRHQEVAGGGMSILDYVESEKLYLNNGQTQIIAGPDAGGDDPRRSPAKDLLSRALENLDKHFAVVGLSERFVESLALLRRRFGWPNVRYHNENVTQNRPARAAVPQKTIERIRELNQLDLRLYDWAARRFEEERRSLAA